MRVMILVHETRKGVKICSYSKPPILILILRNNNTFFFFEFALVLMQIYRLFRLVEVHPKLYVVRYDAVRIFELSLSLKFSLRQAQVVR